MPHTLPQTQWQQHASRHRLAVTKWTVPHRKRKDSRDKHPVYDFLFTYYPFSLSKLENWHPGLGATLEFEGDEPPALYQTKHYQNSANHITLDPGILLEKEVKRMSWIHNLLSLTQHRPANFACFGMHEWAMVYKTDQAGIDIRHRETAPLRFSREETDQIVETRPICCSHFDAFRFFTPPALGFNKIQPTLDDRENFEQPGCLHTNMDLYKWASKCMPWIGSDLHWKCFQLALKTRELDMRASPYDLSQYGYTPVKIETPEGRVEYENLQREITQEGKPLRQQLIDILGEILRSR
ncbi:MAG: 3-methyladenine DNA glycosylase [Akkermansiaceae bacterium]